ncbi:hypothetical protein E1B28_009824 [Marasmius oreades]|uniref:Poly [ADP-ribose] polymerase n=1 Tax=Marasmius oreades TaxID=181124 RepID=A0A9P7RVW7_9AGAR|nr:uncharacterized protein E1B28_009824 [Marasmius oreades]KAG7090734.1 hypothetical protein E1B28_009824 [Marasmius oreades]
MAPRKKVTSDAPAAPTRSSARNKAAQEAQATAAAASQQSNDDGQIPATKKPASKRKRAVASDDEGDASKSKKPVSKKAKKGAGTAGDNPDEADVAIDSDQEKEVKNPKSKKPSSKKSASKKATAQAAEIEEESVGDDATEKEEAKMVTVVKRGAAPVDPRSGKVNTHQVYVDNEVWDATLNQTDVKDNKNKFYNLQLLCPIGNNGSCELYTHWGRVGEGGQHQFKGPFPASAAISEFKKQFKSKAGVNWEDRVGMVAKKGKYTWLERDYDDKEVNEGSSKPKSQKATKGKESHAIPDSTLAPEIQEFCRLIFNSSITDATLSSMNYDANKLPLGKLAKSTILKGFTALKSLSEVIYDSDTTKIQEYGSKQRACEELTNLYYSIIPHSFGRNRPIVINSAELLKRELDLVDALGEMEIASHLMNTIEEDEAKNPINPLDAQFRSLELTSMEPIKKNSQEFKTIERYVGDTHGETHLHFKVDVQNIFRVERGSETQAWKQAGFDEVEDGERMLLWHGSRSTNYAGILTQGLRIAPPEAPVNGYMFGKGVYFADVCYVLPNRSFTRLINDL